MTLDEYGTVETCCDEPVVYLEHPIDDQCCCLRCRSLYYMTGAVLGVIVTGSMTQNGVVDIGLSMLITCNN